MPRLAVATLLGLALLAVALVVGAAATDRRDLAFTLGVLPAAPAAKLYAGHEACQTPILLPDAVSAIRFTAGARDGPGPPLAVRLRAHRRRPGRTLAGGTVRGGYRRAARRTVDIPTVSGDRWVAVCIANRGRRPVELYGQPGLSARQGALYLDDKQLDKDLMLVFLRDDRRSMLSAVPDVFERASLFRPGWVGPWTFWTLAVAILVGAPLLLVLALAAATRES